MTGKLLKHLTIFFVNIVLSLKPSPKENYEIDVGNDNEPILNYINNFKNHSRIKVIKFRKKEDKTFTFNYVSYEETKNCDNDTAK